MGYVQKAWAGLSNFVQRADAERWEQGIADAHTQTDAINIRLPAGQPFLLDRLNHTGIQSLDTTTDSPTRLALSTAERTKLTGVSAGATVNATDAQLRARSSHTGTQAISTVADLQATLDSKSVSTHAHSATDHGALTGLTDDDHAQYALADGSRGSFASTTQGSLAGTAVQPSAVGDLVADAINTPGTTQTAFDARADVAVAPIAPTGGVRAVGKGELVVNLRDYGVVASGTTDNLAAMQAGLNAIAAAGGGVGHLPPGRYGYNGTLTVPSGVILRGSGQRLWVTKTTTAEKQTGTMLVPLTAASVVSIEGTSGASTTHAEAAQLRDLTIDGATTTTVGVQVTNAFDITLSNVFIRACVTGIKVTTTTTSDFIENLRLRDVKITNGTVGIDATGSASKGFIDSTGLHIRNMVTAGVRGAWTGVFSGGFFGRIGTTGLNDGRGFDLVDADGVTIQGVPFENVSTPVMVRGNSVAVTVAGCVTNSSDPGFGLLRAVDVQKCDGWAVFGCKFLFTNGTASAVGVRGLTDARYGMVNGNVYQQVTGSMVKVSISNPAINAVNVDGRWLRTDTDLLNVGTGVGAATLGFGGAAATARSLIYYTGAPGIVAGQRWAARAGLSAEGGSDAGSDYEVVSYNDSGASAAVRMRLRRSDGRATFFGPLQLPNTTTAARPTPATAGIGGCMFDTTLGRPIFSTGSAWVDAAGVTV